jgi:type I restriction enzyme S subunit
MTLSAASKRIGSGITPRGGSSVYRSSGRPFVRSQNVGWGSLKLSGLAHIDNQTHASFNASEIRAGDVLLNITGASIGRSAVATELLDGGNVNQHVCEIRVDPSKVDPSFVCAVLLSDIGQRQIASFQAGGNREGLNFQQVGSILIPAPPIAEQAIIAALLTSADGLIASLERLIDKKTAVKQGMMQQLLTGRTRLPGFRKPWAAASVFELANDQRGLFNDGDWVESEHITTYGNRLLQTGNIGLGRLLDQGTKRYVSDESFAALKCKEVVPGDILICRLAEPAGRACLVEDIGERRMLTSVDVTIYRPDPHLADRRFLVAAFSTPNWFQEISQRCGGSTRTRIARSELGRMTVLLPDVVEQAHIADALADVDAEIMTLRARLSKARTVKLGMMQQLLTGRTRLPALEAAA